MRILKNCDMKFFVITLKVNNRSVINVGLKIFEPYALTI